ncbi:MAG: hypothetical protein M3P06_14555 [Acidobacteriota bacterium]|nr:hypothetical protein [Acidobacteriota bacterium]
MRYVTTEAGDDAEFIAFTETVLTRVTLMQAPGIHITRINGWFGEKWIGFSGKVMGAFGVHYREEMDIPPFVPNRVITSTYLKLVGGRYEPSESAVQLHIHQRSESNFRRKVREVVPADVLIWFSGGSERDGRGSILAYVPTVEGHTPGFLSLARDPSWRIIKSIGLSPSELVATNSA